MPCKQWNDGWIARLYGELTPDEDRALDAHLDECAPCRTTLDELRASHELLQAAAPEVPATPRVVVLRPRPIWSNAWAFAAGAVCALLLFGLGFVAGPRWSNAAGDVQTEMARVDTIPPAALSETVVEAEASPAAIPPATERTEDLLAVEQRLDRLEQQPTDGFLTPVDLQEELERLERRVNQERVRDLEYVVRTLTASELRTGTWMDQTQEAITLLALRQDPRIHEQ